MVRAEQRGDDDPDLCRDKGEGDGEPSRENVSLELQVSVLAAGEVAAGETQWRLRRLDIRREIPTTLQGVLDTESTFRAEVSGPLEVDLALEVERLLLVRHVSWRDDQCEADPKHQGVDGEEGSVVEHDARVTNERGEGHDGSRDGGH